MKKNIMGGGFSFKSDKIENFAFWEKLFSKEECEQIISIYKNDNLIKASTLGKIKNYRDSNICWIYPSEDTKWIFNKISEAVINLNERFFNFDLNSIIEGIQFTNYKSPFGKYKKHVDRFFDFTIRKISISVQLTDTKKYEGGELKLYYGEDPLIMSKTQGTLIMFPSYVLHEVSPITKGERNSLVTWVTGPQFK